MEKSRWNYAEILQPFEFLCRNVFIAILRRVSSYFVATMSRITKPRCRRTSSLTRRFGLAEEATRGLHRSKGVLINQRMPCGVHARLLLDDRYHLRWEWLWFYSQTIGDGGLPFAIIPINQRMIREMYTQFRPRTIG